MEKNAKIYVAGHRGMVGSAIVRELERQGYTNIITRTHKELDLTRQEAVEAFFADEKPEYVFLAAAKVGGIVANESALADFMYNPQIQIFAEFETKRPFFECSFKTKRSKKDLHATRTTEPEIRAKITLFRAWALSSTIQQAI